MNQKIFTCKFCKETRKFKSQIAYNNHLEAKHDYPPPKQRKLLKEQND